MGKPKRERSLSDSEAQAVARNLRVSPRKLNLVAGLIRGKAVDTALADLEFSRKRIAQDVRKCVMSAVANAENNHGLDVNELVVSEAFVGKTIRVDGTATAVCAHMGCWMAVSETAKAESATVRLKVEDGVIVFPVSAKGKAVSAQGTFERIKADDEEGKEAASEHAKHQAKPEAATAKYQLKATGAIVR